MSSMHFGVASVIGRRRLPIPAARRKAFTPRALRTTPRARIRAFASASTPSRPSMPSSHVGVRRDRFGRRALRLPAQRPEGADVREDVAGVAEAVLAGHHAWLGRTRTGA